MAPTEAEVSCVLSPQAFRSVWTLLVALYAFITLYLLAHAAMYAVFYAFPITYYYTTTFQLLSAESYPIVSGAYAATALLYIQQLVMIIGSSIRHGELRFATSSPSTTTRAPVSHRYAWRFPAKARRLYAFLFSTTGLLGVRGPFFGVMTLLRESLEIAIQILQAYQSSRYTASLWINLTFGGLIVTNCFSTPLLHWWFRSAHEAHRAGTFRLVVLSVDLALDLVWFLVLPFLFWLPYYTALRGKEALFYDDTFMPKALMELRFIFVTSFGDLVFVKLLPAFSVFFALKKVQHLVRGRPRRRQSRSQKTTMSRASHSVHVALLAQLVPVAASPLHDVPHSNRTLQRIDRLLTLVLATTGLFAVVIYVVAYLVYTPHCVPGCLVILRPWFEVNDAHCFCAVQEINCSLHRTHGSGEELTRTFESLETRGLLALILTHCDALTIPVSLLRFRDLYRFELFNCTIASWPAATALTASAFPQLGIVSLISTAITTIPEGLLQGDLPPTLREIHIVDSNLATLPDNLNELWPHVTTFYLERAAFTEFPKALSRMPQLKSLTMYKNNISTIDDEAFDNNSFEYLLVNDNPLRSLPSSLRKSTRLTQLELQNTEIESAAQATQWTSSSAEHSDATTTTIYGAGSPFCQETSVAQASLPARVTVTCETRFYWYNGEKSFSWYPFEGKVKQRQLRPS